MVICRHITVSDALHDKTVDCICKTFCHWIKCESWFLVKEIAGDKKESAVESNSYETRDKYN